MKKTFDLYVNLLGLLALMAFILTTDAVVWLGTEFWFDAILRIVILTLAALWFSRPLAVFFAKGLQRASNESV